MTREAAAPEINAIATAFAALLAALIAFALHLENAWWAAISAWMIMNVPEPHAVFVKGFLRIAGTIVGAVVGCFITAQVEGYASLQMIVLGTAVALGCYQRHHAEYAYAWFIGFLMIAMLIAESLQEPTEVVSFAYWRVYEIITGVSVATAVIFCMRRVDPAAAATPAPAAKVDERQLAIACVFAGVVVVLIVAIWQFYDIPSIFQVIVTITAVQFPDLADTRRMALNRLAGCIMGGTAGLLMVGLANQALMLWALTFFFGMFVLSLIHHGGSRRIHPYIGTQAGMAFIIAMITADGPSSTILPVLDRLTGIFLAFVIVGALAYAVEPWTRRRPASG